MKRTASCIKAGYTLTEVIVVLVIIAIIAAISIPLWAPSKKRAFEETTKNTLRQSWIALSLYREQNDGNAISGTRSELGLPGLDDFTLTFLKSNGIQWPMSPGRVGYGPIYYPLDPSDNVTKDNSGKFDRRLRDWLTVSRRDEEKSILIGDFHHTEGCGKYPDISCVFSGFGVTLAGALRSQRSNGMISSPMWWEEQKQ